MKTVIIQLCLAIALVTGISACATQSRVYVAESRPVVREVRPAPPFRGAIWVGPEYVWRKGQYMYIEPHYVKPNRGHVWVPGYWQGQRGKKVWVSGYWGRR